MIIIFVCLSKIHLSNFYLESPISPYWRCSIIILTNSSTAELLNNHDEGMKNVFWGEKCWVSNNLISTLKCAKIFQKRLGRGGLPHFPSYNQSDRFFTIMMLYQEFFVWKSVETNSQGNNPPISILTKPKRTMTVLHENFFKDRTEICTKIMDLLSCGGNSWLLTIGLSFHNSLGSS